MYTADLMALVAAFVGSAYIIIKTVDSGVSMTRGYYATFAGGSTLANSLLSFEIAVIALWELFALAMSVSGLYEAFNIWNLMDNRLGEASAATKGLENAFTWEKAIKGSILLMIVGLSDLISAFTLGDIADEVVSWFGQYDNDTKTEGSDKEDGDLDANGTSAENDIYLHMGLTFYGFIALAAISVGGNYFVYNFIENIFNDGFGVNCDLDDTDSSKYSNFYNLAKTMKDRASCEKVIDQIFAIEDIDKNGLVTRCEDAKFQFANGSTKEYALKFSSQYTIGAFRNICNENFSS